MSAHSWTEYLGLMAQGGIVTVELTLASLVVGTAAASIAGLARISNRTTVRAASRIYIEFFRGSSSFVQLFAAYYLLPFAGINLSAFACAVLVLGLNIGAYGAENVRSAVLSVRRDQYEACTVLNLTRWQSLRRVILPQALPVLTPLFGNNAVELLKATSIVSLITIGDLTFQGQLVRFQTGDTIGPFAVILTVYFVLALAIGAGTRALMRLSRRAPVTVTR
jgi:polar amino acid transport system permease protein